jgi:hypothetical protein
MLILLISLFFKKTKKKKNFSNTQKKNENITFTTPTQHTHNTPSHEGGPHTLGPTLM